MKTFLYFQKSNFPRCLEQNQKCAAFSIFMDLSTIAQETLDSDSIAIFVIYISYVMFAIFERSSKLEMPLDSTCQNDKWEAHIKSWNVRGVCYIRNHLLIMRNRTWKDTWLFQVFGKQISTSPTKSPMLFANTCQVFKLNKLIG